MVTHLATSSRRGAESDMHVIPGFHRASHRGPRVLLAILLIGSATACDVDRLLRAKDKDTSPVGSINSATGIPNAYAGAILAIPGRMGRLGGESGQRERGPGEHDGAAHRRIH